MNNTNEAVLFNTSFKKQNFKQKQCQDCLKRHICINYYQIRLYAGKNIKKITNEENVKQTVGFRSQ